MIHPGAIIDPRAQIAADVSIGPFVVIEGPVVIGAGTVVYNNVYITGDTVIGEGCLIHPFCSIGHFPQDFSFREGLCSGLTIGAGCEFREGVTIHRSTLKGGRTLVGDGVYLMTGSHIGHDSRIGDRVTMANNTHLGGYAVVEEGATFSGNISVHQRVRVGALSMTGASSFLNRDLPPFCLAIGVPARVVGLNVVGLRRAGYDREALAAVKAAFRCLYREGHTPAIARERLAGLGSAAALRLAAFLEGSPRGILSGRRRGRVGGA